MSARHSSGTDAGAQDLGSLFTCEVEQLPDAALFPELPRPIWTEQLFRSNELVNLYTDLSVIELLRGLGVELDAAASATRECPLDVTPELVATVEWLVRKARGSVWLASSAEELRACGLEGPVDSARVAARRAILAELPELAPTLELLDLAREGYPRFLFEGVAGSEILFSSNTLSLWERFFSNENPLYAPTNALASQVAAARVAERSESAGRRLRVLEVGAGCGSAAQELLADSAGRVGQYTLTDISPHFLRIARERVEALDIESVEVGFRGLDLDRDPSTWKLDAGSVDLVFAVNVLHCARDLERSLRGLRNLLAPGGCIALGECVRPLRGRPVHPEFVFQLLDEFRDVLLDPQWRPAPGFLDADGWRGAFAAAGFTKVEVLPEFEPIARAYGEYSVGAIVGSL